MIRTSAAVRENSFPWKRRISLRVYRGKNLIFSSRSRWLYPLFELSEHIARRNLDTESLVLHDRIAGRAAAALICRMGFPRCHIDIISQPALSLFEEHRVNCTFGTLVPQIACRTEETIHKAMGLDEIYRLLKDKIRPDRGIALEIQDLQTGCQGRTVLKGLSLSLSGGEQLIITGDNGMGKTTLLRAIIGAIPLQGGKIILGEPGKQKKRRAALLVGYVAQSAKSTSFPLAAEEVAAMGLTGQHLPREEAEAQIEAAMRRTGCFNLRHRNFYTLSGGEQQRVSLARCLCQKAGLLLMDEPTSFLDADAKEELREVLQKIVSQQGPTVLLVSHDHQWISQLGWRTRKMEEGRLC